MSVAKPWMSPSPAPSMSQTLGGEPGLLFSQLMALPPEPHGSVAAPAGDAEVATATTSDDRIIASSTATRAGASIE